MNFSPYTLVLAGLIVALFLWLRSDIKELSAKVGKHAERIGSLADRISLAGHAATSAEIKK